MPLFPLCSTSEQNGKRRQMEAADPPGAEPKKNCLRSHKHTCGTLPPSVLSIILLVPALRSLSLPRPHIAVSQKAADVTHYLQQRSCCSGNRGEGVDGLPSVFLNPELADGDAGHLWLHRSKSSAAVRPHSASQRFCCIGATKKCVHVHLGRQHPQTGRQFDPLSHLCHSGGMREDVITAYL